jgi:hypothetical protein
MTTQEWQLIKKYTPNYFTCVYTWVGVILGSLVGVILLESIIRMIGQ